MEVLLVAGLTLERGFTLLPRKPSTLMNALVESAARLVQGR